MPPSKKLEEIIIRLLKKFISVEQPVSYQLQNVNNVLIVRQHNQFGDLLASVSLFRAVKETYPSSKITLLASRENYFGVEKNEFIDSLLVYNNRKIWNPFYLLKLLRSLRQKYDLAIVPSTVAISTTSCLFAAFSDARIKIGPKSLNGKENKFAFVFHYPIDLNWKRCPDAHVSDFILDVVRPFGINTKDYSSSIGYEESDLKHAENFIKSLNGKPGSNVIGFHVGAGKTPNRWPLEKFINLISILKQSFPIEIYFTGSSADKDEIDFIKQNLNYRAGYFINKSIPQLAALISRSDLFITNDTGVMHVAGAVKTPQVSIFGPTNQFNWAPLGPNKYYIRKSEFISDITEEEILSICKIILEKKNG